MIGICPHCGSVGHFSVDVTKRCLKYLKDNLSASEARVRELEAKLGETVYSTKDGVDLLLVRGCGCNYIDEIESPDHRVGCPLALSATKGEGPTFDKDGFTLDMRMSELADGEGKR